MVKASPAMQHYFASINAEVKSCYDLTSAARKLGLDPETEPPIPLANNMAERVVGLISVVVPQIQQSPVTARIQELEKEFGQLDWRVGFKIAEEVAREKFFPCRDKHEAIEVGIRVGFAYLTLGIVSAPLEGFIGLKIKKRHDGREYFSLQYAGPIRGAGGTAASTSVILADYVRVQLGYAPYDPQELEINRTVTEIGDYHERVTNLQYRPAEEELRFMISHLPVEVDGDPTEKIEVSNYKDLPRIETNLIRGGVALVLAEGLCQKAPKLWKRLSRWGKDFNLEWDWLAEFLKLKEKIHATHAKEAKSEKKTVKPNNTFIMDLVAGRPILTHPLAEGGFRLRYGRGRTTGFSATALHPATLAVLDKYIAIGTQLKVERPGKAASVTICETLEGPIVRLKDGTVLQLTNELEAKQVASEIEEILFLGDILFNYGDFSENGHPLIPAGYCPEWWAVEVERALQQKYQEEGEKWSAKAAEFLLLDQSRLLELIQQPLFFPPTWEEALQISPKLAVPLHSDFLFYWKLVSAEDIILLLRWLAEGSIKRVATAPNHLHKIILPLVLGNDLHAQAKKIMEFAGIPHKVINKENVVLEQRETQILGFCLGFSQQSDLARQQEALKTKLPLLPGKTGLEALSLLCPIPLRDKAGTFIGARMGRPEKAKMREMTGSPQVMFPVGEEGNRLRSFQAALQAGKVTSTFPHFFCLPCQRESIYSLCEECHLPCQQKYFCPACGSIDKETCRHGTARTYHEIPLDIKYYFSKALQRLDEKTYPDLIKGIRGTSNKRHLVEHLSKGILRAKHRIYVNKDGTTRYDGTELPLTHFKAKEIKTSLEKLRHLGYTKDCYGKELHSEEQILELKPQDIILPGYDSLDESAPKVLFRVAQFVDDLLVKFYHLPAYYNLKKEEDLVGNLVVGLAPHISAGLIGRIIGFSETQTLLAHPMWHAGLRRDCDGDEACLMLLLDALLNFSRQYLPEKRGAKTMDSPLVLTSILNPSEVDDQVHGIDTVWRYPLEFYQAALEHKNASEVKLEQLKDRLGTAAQYEGFGFTHHVENFNKGVQCSAYKILPSMEEKLLGQMEIARKIRAVDMDDVAKLVIQKHFLKDIKGNLRKFSMQQFRCSKCNEKYRRPPLNSKCTCGGKLIFTISEGSVLKYLGLSLLLAEKYNFSPYLKQTLEIVKVHTDSIFGKEREKQSGLGQFLG